MHNLSFVFYVFQDLLNNFFSWNFEIHKELAVVLAWKQGRFVFTRILQVLTDSFEIWYAGKYGVMDNSKNI